MLRLLADKPGADAVTVVLADMAHLAEGPGAEEIAAAGPYTVAFAAFNTFFNLAHPTTNVAVWKACSIFSCRAGSSSSRDSSRPRTA